MDSGSACHVYLGVSQILSVSPSFSVLPLSTPAGSQDSGLGRQTGRAGQPGWEGQCLGFPGALRAPDAGHRELLFLPHHISFYDPASTLELRSWLQLPLHSASKQSQAFLAPRFHTHGDTWPGMLPLGLVSSTAFQCPVPVSPLR